MSAPCSDRHLLFKTPRLGIRPYAATDRVAHDRLRRDPDVVRFMHWPDDESFDALCAEAEGRTPPDDLGWINLAVVSLEIGQLVGDHGLIVREGLACMGLALLPDYRNRGLARELVAGSLAWLGRCGYPRAQAEIDFGNARSFALFGHLGFRIVDDRSDAFGRYSVLERDLTGAS